MVPRSIKHVFPADTCAVTDQFLCPYDVCDMNGRRSYREEVTERWSKLGCVQGNAKPIRSASVQSDRLVYSQISQITVTIQSEQSDHSQCTVGSTNVQSGQ